MASNIDFTASRLPPSIWTATLQDFLGRTATSESFAFDGRSEEFEIYFDAEPGPEPVWAIDDYSVHPVADPDFEPASTVLLRYRGNTVGFYAGGMCWIDPGHRGKQLSTTLIVAANLVHGAVPYDRGSGMGFSRAGIAAHQAAHRWTVLRAEQYGLPVPHDVAASVSPAVGFGSQQEQPASRDPYVPSLGF